MIDSTCKPLFAPNPCLQADTELDEARAALQSRVDKAAGLHAALESARQRHAEQLRRCGTLCYFQNEGTGLNFQLLPTIWQRPCQEPA